LRTVVPLAGHRRGGAATPGKHLADDALSTAEIEALLYACSRRAATGTRNAAMLALLWRSGLRLGEALALRPHDVDLDGGTIRIHWAKGGKQRVVGLDAGTGALIGEWLRVRATRVRSRSAPLFCTLDGGVMQQSYVRHLLPRLARRAGIEKRVHAHALRHAYAVDLEREGAPLSTIRDLLGHSSAATTDRYLRRLGAGDAVAFARSREWQLPSRNSHALAERGSHASIESRV
jgi:site-specific recombinase XerD